MREQAEQAQDANPNSSGPQRLAGDMGLSSEREGDDLEGIQGTGTVGSAKEHTDGTQPTEPAPARPHPEDPAEGADDDEVVEEQNTAEVPSHPNDPAKNPGHSHG